MTSSSLLADLVANRGLQPEPVATDALAHILETSPSARDAIQALLASWFPSATFEQLSFVGQASGTATVGRPDIVGSDAQGARIVIEAKFDAALTEHQLSNGYLDWLPADQPGALVFLVPEDRLALIWSAVLVGPGGQDSAPPASEITADGPDLRAEAGGGRLLVAMGWQRLLGLLDAAVAGTDHSAFSDLAQLRGLVQWRTRTQWVPILSGDLSDRQARQLVGLRDANDAAAKQVSSQTTRNGSRDSGPGRWWRTKEGHWLWSGIWLRGWALHGDSPLWITHQAETGANFAKVLEALSPLRQPGGPGMYSDARLRRCEVPVLPPNGQEAASVLASVVTQFRRVSELIDMLPSGNESAPESASPLEPAIDDL